MLTLPASEARAKLYRLIEDASVSRSPVMITRSRTHALLVPANQWQAIQETLALLALPGMLEAIREGVSLPVEHCARTLDW